MRKQITSEKPEQTHSSGHSSADAAQPESIPSASTLRKTIVNLAWPVVLELLLVSLLGMVNMIMVGHLGANALAAVGITSQPVLICFILFQAFNIGGTALVARAVGQGDDDLARRISALTLWLNALAGVVVGMGTFLASEWLVRAMGAKPDYLAEATLYMRWSALGVVLQAVPTGVSALTRGAGNTRLPAAFNLIANLVNVALGYVLIYGPLGLPRLGILGAGIAQLGAKAVAMALSLWAMLRSDNLRIRITGRSLLRPEFSSLGRLIKIGLPAAAEQTAMRVGLLVFSKLIADLGAVPLAAHTINMNIQGIIFNFGAALGAAATALTGQSLGRCRPDLAQAYLRETRRLGLATSVVFSAVLALFPRAIASLFTPDPDILAASQAILWVGAAIVPFQTSQLILCGGLRGAGDTVWPLVATMSGVLIVRVLAGYLCIRVFGWGLPGGWYAFLFDQATRSLVIWLRFLSGKWKYRTI